MLGAERLFENAPKVEFGEVAVVKRTSGTSEAGGLEMAILRPIARMTAMWYNLLRSYQ